MGTVTPVHDQVFHAPAANPPEAPPISAPQRGIGIALSLLGIVGIALTSVYLNRLSSAQKIGFFVASGVVVTGGVTVALMRRSAPPVPYYTIHWVTDLQTLPPTPALGKANRPPMPETTRVFPVSYNELNGSGVAAINPKLREDQDVVVVNLKRCRFTTKDQAQTAIYGVCHGQHGCELNIGNPALFVPGAPAPTEEQLMPWAMLAVFLDAALEIAQTNYKEKPYWPTRLCVYTDDPSDTPRHLRFYRPALNVPCVSVPLDKLKAWRAAVNAKIQEITPAPR